MSRGPPVRLALSTLLGAALLAGGPTSARAASERQAVQERKYGSTAELRLALGSMPLDPFQKGWTAGLSYTHHLDPLWAWEVLQVTGALLTPTSLRDQLVDTFARRPEEFAAPRFMITTGVEASPFYGKQVLFNQSTLHGTVLLGAYGGAIFGDRPTLGETLEDARPALGGGLGFRVYSGDLVSFRFDSRVFAAFRRAIRADESAEVETVGLFTLSVSLGLGGRP